MKVDRNLMSVRNDFQPDAETKLWQAVVYQALRDATFTSEAKEAKLNQRRADAWLRNGGADFRMVCDLAGFDPPFIRDAYLSGRIDAELLRGGESRREETRRNKQKRRAAE